MYLFDYNKKTYDALLTKLHSHSRVAVVQCTGSGKGAIATTLITEGLSRKKVLLLAPRNAILMNYLKSFGIDNDNRVHLKTYQNICTLSEDELKKIGNLYDVLILDEYHRCGAEKWGKAVNILVESIEKHNGRIIGFTATPKRYLDNERDMTEELFNGIAIEGVDLTSAIKKGILPTFTYVKAKYGYTSYVNEYKKYCRENKAKGKIDSNRIALVSDNDKYIHDIIVKETSGLKGCQKWIVFCSNIKELNEIAKHIPKWFDKSVNIFSSHSGLSPMENENSDTFFRTAYKGINLLLTVDKYTEGVHLKDISGVIMMRQTLSPIVFLQQLGRALSAGNIGQKPIIFDFVSNIESIQDYEDLIMYDLQIMAEDVNAYAERRAKKDPSKGGKIILKSYCEEIDKVLADIRKVIGRKWSPEEDEIIKQNYPIMKKEVYKLLEGRTQDATYQRARFLGMIPKREWTMRENNIIKKYYPIEGVGVVVRLNKINKNKKIIRTEKAIKAQATILGVKIDKNRCWSEEDDNLLYRKNKNGKYDIVEMGRLLGYKFTTSLIYNRLEYLGFDYSRTAKWSDDEKVLVHMAWGQMSIEELERRLPRHTREAIIREASYQGATAGKSKRKAGSRAGDVWSEKDIQDLIYAYNTMDMEDCYEFFSDRTERAIQQKITNLKKDYNYKHLFKK